MGTWGNDQVVPPVSQETNWELCCDIASGCQNLVYLYKTLMFWQDSFSWQNHVSWANSQPTRPPTLPHCSLIRALAIVSTSIKNQRRSWCWQRQHHLALESLSCSGRSIVLCLLSSVSRTLQHQVCDAGITNTKQKVCNVNWDEFGGWSVITLSQLLVFLSWVPFSPRSGMNLQCLPSFMDLFFLLLLKATCSMNEKSLEGKQKW